MRTVLLTGGSGLLALSWARAVADTWRVHLALHQRSIQLEGAESHTIEWTSPHDFERVLDETKPDLVVHTAGLTDVELCERDPDAAHRVNVLLAENVARSCARHGLSLAHISTDHLFAGDQAMVDELQPTQALNVYGASKAEGEQRVLAAAPLATVLRTNFYGWGPRHRHSFSDRIIHALRRSEPISLFEDVFFTPVLADVLIEVAHALAEDKASGIYNVSGDERLSKFEFGLAIADAFGLDRQLVRRSRLSQRMELTKRPLEMSLSNRKVVARLGYDIGDINNHLARLVRLESDPRVMKVQQL